jgi:hypothetical protein
MIPELPGPSKLQGGAAVGSTALFDDSLVLGALDSLGVALTNHNHQWTDGERAIYEEAAGILTSRADCKDSGLVDSETLPALKPCWRWRLASCRASVRLLALEYSLWRVALAVGHLAMSTAFRCCVWICSWCVILSNSYIERTFRSLLQVADFSLRRLILNTTPTVSTAKPP